MLQELALVLVGVLSCIYLYFRYVYKHWDRKGILQEDPIPPVGNFLDVVLKKKNPGWIYAELYKKYSEQEAVGFYEFQTPKLLVRTPELIQQVLVSDFSSFHDNEVRLPLTLNPYLELDSFVMEGEQWKIARNALITGLTKNKLKDMYQLMKMTVPHLYDYLDNHQGKDIEAKELTNYFMTTNVSNAVYGITDNCFTDPNAAIRTMQNIFAREYWQNWWSVLIVFYLQKLRDFLGYTFIPQQVCDYVKDMVTQVVRSRLENNVSRTDFIQYYLNQNKSVEEKIHEIVCHGMTFFIGGMETSSLPSANALYELALNPAIQETLYQELKEAFVDKSELEYDTLISLPYLDKVVKETLRKYPILYASSKVCTKNTILNIEGRNVEMEVGTPVTVPYYAIHMDPKYYPEPDKYDPERFSEQNTLARPPCTYMPFGAGPRICTGMKFGVAQVKLLLASILHNYKVMPSDRTPAKITFSLTSFMVFPAEDQFLRFEKR